MKRALLSLVLLLAVLAGLMSWVHSQPQWADPGKLVNGDWYFVAIERPGHTEQSAGQLVEATDKWIVLGNLLSCSNDEVVGTPILKDLPLLGNFFGEKVRHGYLQKMYRWIPRDAVVVQRREMVSIPKYKNQYKNDRPLLSNEGDVTWFDGSKHQEVFKQDADGSLLAAPRTYECVVKKSATSEWPIIGGLFDTCRTEVRDTTKPVLCEQVMYVQQFVPLTPDEIRLVLSK